jgi:hypothetical protein
MFKDRTQVAACLIAFLVGPFLTSCPHFPVTDLPLHLQVTLRIDSRPFPLSSFVPAGLTPPHHPYHPLLLFDVRVLDIYLWERNT